MPENNNRRRKDMTAVCWRNCIEVIAGPRRWEDTRESWLSRAARKAGVPYRQIKSLYYGESDDPKYSVGTKLVVAAQEARQRATALADTYEQIAGQINALSNNTDKGFVSEQIAALEHVVSSLRSLGDADDN